MSIASCRSTARIRQLERIRDVLSLGTSQRRLVGGRQRITSEWLQYTLLLGRVVVLRSEGIVRNAAPPLSGDRVGFDSRGRTVG